MSYTLKFFETPLVEFEMMPADDGFHVKVLFCKWAKADMLPLGMKVQHGSTESLEKALAQWLQERVQHSERVNMDAVCAQLGLNENDIEGAIVVSRCLSLHDAYWVVPTDCQATLAEMNLYTNELSEDIAHIALTGEGEVADGLAEESYVLTPEFTTAGPRPKCWKREGDDIYLYKAGSTDGDASGQEPYAEYYAADLAKQLGYEAVDYDLKMVDGKLCSVCKVFTNEKIAYVGADQLIAEPGLEAAIRYFYGQAQVTGYDDILDNFANMLIFDALTCNTNRHLGNFGIMLDSHANQPIATAPMFGNGHALFPAATEEDFEDIAGYAAQLKPALYDDFIATAVRSMGPRQIEKLAGAVDFTFTRHPEFNWPEWRLIALEEFIHERARQLLGVR